MLFWGRAVLRPCCPKALGGPGEALGRGLGGLGVGGGVAGPLVPIGPIDYCSYILYILYYGSSLIWPGGLFLGINTSHGAYPCHLPKLHAVILTGWQHSCWRLSFRRVARPLCYTKSSSRLYNLNRYTNSQVTWSCVWSHLHRRQQHSFMAQYQYTSLQNWYLIIHNSIRINENLHFIQAL